MTGESVNIVKRIQAKLSAGISSWAEGGSFTDGDLRPSDAIVVRLLLEHGAVQSGHIYFTYEIKICCERIIKTFLLK